MNLVVPEPVGREAREPREHDDAEERQRQGAEQNPAHALACANPIRRGNGTGGGDISVGNFALAASCLEANGLPAISEL